MILSKITSKYLYRYWGCRDHMVVRFTTTYVINA